MGYVAGHCTGAVCPVVCRVVCVVTDANTPREVETPYNLTDVELTLSQPRASYAAWEIAQDRARTNKLIEELRQDLKKLEREERA